MSHSWANEIVDRARRLGKMPWRAYLPGRQQIKQLIIAPNAIVLAHTGRGTEGGAVHVQHVNAIDGETVTWRDAPNAIKRLLQAHARPGDVVHAVLSDHFVRYTVLPWHEGVTDPREREALVRHEFVRRYGAVAESWTLRLANGPFGTATLVAAIESELFGALQATCVAARIRLARVETFLVHAFNASCDHFAEPNFQFASAEPGRVCVAQIRAGHWHHVHGQRINDAESEGLFAVLAREAMLGGEIDPSWPTYAHVVKQYGQAPVLGQWGPHGIRPLTSASTTSTESPTAKVVASEVHS